MKGNLTEVLSLADDKYLEEANPTKTLSRAKLGWKKIAIIAASLILIAVTVVSVLLVDKNNAGGNGFMPAQPINVQVKYEKSMINIGEDLNVKLSFSTSDYSKRGGVPIATVTTYIIMFSRQIDQEVLINKFEEDLSYEGHWTQDSVFEEEVTVPADWFSEETGGIVWDVLTEVTFSDGTKFDLGPNSGILFNNEYISDYEFGNTAIYYLKTDKGIKIFRSSYDLDKYLRKLDTREKIVSTINNTKANWIVFTVRLLAVLIMISIPFFKNKTYRNYRKA